MLIYCCWKVSCFILFLLCSFEVTSDCSSKIYQRASDQLILSLHNSMDFHSISTMLKAAVVVCWGYICIKNMAKFQIIYHGLQAFTHREKRVTQRRLIWAMGRDANHSILSSRCTNTFSGGIFKDLYIIILEAQHMKLLGPAHPRPSLVVKALEPQAFYDID